MGDVYISGTRWITPVGEGSEVFHAILEGKPAPISEIAALEGHPARRAALVPSALLDLAAKEPRLRRSSRISLAAVEVAFGAGAAAAAAAVEAGQELDDLANRTAVIFAASDGGVIYTRKFYDQVVRQGSGSPLFFPETVYNAPGSHIAAMHTVDGISYTLVGDASVGLAALRLGIDLLESNQADACIVTGAEEVDWVLCEAYAQWRLAGPGIIEIGSNRGTLLAEAAASIILAREPGEFRLEVTDGVPFFRRTEAEASLTTALDQLQNRDGITQVISSANGTFVDRAERRAIEKTFGELPTLHPKVTLGEAFGASALMQIICAVESLRRNPSGPVLVPVIGLNQQAAAAIVSRAG